MSANDGAGRRSPPGCALTAGRITYLVIIAVLGYLLVCMIAPIPIRPSLKLARAEALFSGLSMALDHYKVRHHVYPPDRATGFDPDLDQLAECLVYYLSGGSMAYGPGEPPPGILWTHRLFRDPSADGTGRKAIIPACCSFPDRFLADSDGDGIPEVIDPWGTPFHYNVGGEANGPFNANGAPKHNKDKFDLSSAGPDKKHGTADDIKNWDE